MSKFKVTLTFSTIDPRRPQEFLALLLRELPAWAKARLLDSKISVVNPPNPAKVEAQVDGQLEGFLLDTNDGKMYPT